MFHLYCVWRVSWADQSFHFSFLVVRQKEYVNKTPLFEVTVIRINFQI